MSDEETWTAEQCCEAWGGIKVPTWRSYVSRGYAPKPLPGWDDDRKLRWDPAAVREAYRLRDGRSTRTDLHGRKRDQVSRD